MLSYVCDRCQKIMPANDKQTKMVRLTIKNHPADDKDIDLCSDCFDMFNMFILNKEPEDNDDSVGMSLVEGGFECPRCYTHYVFEVTDERRINVLYKGNNHVDVKTGVITHPPFVNFNCPICNLLLKIPESILKEVNK